MGLWVEIGGFMGIVICFCYLIHITEKYVGIICDSCFSYGVEFLLGIVWC